ncbi:hypothetical protein [Photorhabdus stackebrandtii]|uniref:Wzy n=1 Tax=Photorhabdus stackebrandtii TaxID=1123042 RepID=A0A7X5QL66_9GAMM|nr:hypothetical protein [Photorhabdus stackebrandtii]NHB96448.1 hypothetical protein [Photorhabdus stackebrandtii]
MHSILINKNINTAHFLQKILTLLFSVSTFLTLSPYFTWNLPYYFRFFCILAILTFFIYTIHGGKLKKNGIWLSILFFIIIFSLSLSSKNETLFNGSVFFILFFLCLPDFLKLNIFNVFKIIYAISLLPGLIYFFLILFGLGGNWEIILPLNPLKNTEGLYYRVYYGMVILSNQIYSISTGEIFRFSAMYDEPGVVGTVSALILAASGFNLKRKINKIILLSGILSFSLAFYISIFIFLIFKPKILLKITSITTITIFISLSSLKNVSLIQYYVFDRFSLILNGFDKVDNRISLCFQNYFSDFLNHKDTFWGLGYNAYTLTDCDVSSYITLIYDFGFFGFFLILIFYSLLSFSISNNFIKKDIFIRWLPMILVYLANIYQRPTVFDPWSIVILCGGLIYSIKDSRINSCSK